MREMVGVLNNAERSAPVRIVKMLELINPPSMYNHGYVRRDGINTAGLTRDRSKARQA